MKQRLEAEQLYTFCAEALGDFATTDDLDPTDAGTGQERAVSAIRYAIDMHHNGYNLYVAGSPGLGKRELVREILAAHRNGEGEITDWCYLNNFDSPHQPRLINLPKGRGCTLKQDMDRLIERLLVTLPGMFQSDEYRQRMTRMRDEYQEREEALFEALNHAAGDLDLAVLRTPNGFTIGPVRDGKLLSAPEFNKLPEAEQERIKQNIEIINKQLQESLETIGSWQEESIERVSTANNEFVRAAIDPVLQRLKESWSEFPTVADHLERVHEDVITNAGDFFVEETQQNKLPSKKLLESPQFVRYRVNVLVDNTGTDNVPILYEDNPTYQNLIGRIEHTAQLGTLVTNFTLIKPGALHRANGGYLLLDAYKLLTNPFSYDALKRVISSREIRVESIEQQLSLVSTTSLEPESMPANVKIVLLGNRRLYHLLKSHDPEFGLLFKIQADFSETLDRNANSIGEYARIVAGVVREQSLLPFTKSGVARVIEHSARLVEDRDKLSLHRESLADLLREADYQARRQGADGVTDTHVDAAIAEALYRNDRYQQLMQEMIEKGVMLIATDGEHVAQINGLSVYQLGDVAFGRPTRITATARPGSGKVVDIERESELGGTIHSKGVMILSALLGSRYAVERPLALAATLVFEQSYGFIDGDSASVAELLALLSAIAEVPLAQSLAVTGSINQHGQVQAIGGVNDKIEGFFDICARQGLTGSQGVAIPASNLRHLMLRRDVVDACRDSRFHIYSIETIDDAVELFTGLPAGARLESGAFEAGSLNERVQQRLDGFVEALRRARGGNEEDNGRG